MSNEPSSRERFQHIHIRRQHTRTLPLPLQMASHVFIECMDIASVFPINYVI